MREPRKCANCRFCSSNMIDVPSTLRSCRYNAPSFVSVYLNAQGTGGSVQLNGTLAGGALTVNGTSMANASVHGQLESKWPPVQEYDCCGRHKYTDGYLDAVRKLRQAP